MNRLVEIVLAALASSSAAHRVSTMVWRSIAGAACALLAAAFAAAAIGCGAAALWLYIDAVLGPVDAALLTAAALLAAALLLLAAARYFVRPRGAPPAAGGFDIADLTRLMAEHKGTLLAAAAILGMLAGSEDRRPDP
jgi:hypothetical protein